MATARSIIAGQPYTLEDLRNWGKAHLSDLEQAIIEQRITGHSWREVGQAVGYSHEECRRTFAESIAKRAAWLEQSELFERGAIQ